MSTVSARYCCWGGLSALHDLYSLIAGGVRKEGNACYFIGWKVRLAGANFACDSRRYLRTLRMTGKKDLSVRTLGSYLVEHLGGVLRTLFHRLGIGNWLRRLQPRHNSSTCCSRVGHIRTRNARAVLFYRVFFLSLPLVRVVFWSVLPQRVRRFFVLGVSGRVLVSTSPLVIRIRRLVTRLVGISPQVRIVAFIFCRLLGVSTTPQVVGIARLIACGVITASPQILRVCGNQLGIVFSNCLSSGLCRSSKRSALCRRVRRVFGVF